LQESLTQSAGDQRTAQAQEFERLRQIIENRLDAIRTESAGKLEEIRKTVDEQLQATLNERITSSFKIVHAQLEQVYRGLGEMQKLAEGVGDLKRVLTNVRARGVFGEVQLGSLMEQMFSPDQYIENAQVRENSQERVEFAVRIPGRSGEGDVLLPIDAKFPIDDYERILKASERADPAGVEVAAVQLEAKIRASAKDIGDKYINPPKTSDFAILFLPIEGLYAEVLRRPGLIESVQETHHVVIAGPTTLLAMLSAFRMAVRAVAIQRRSTEVWQILGSVKQEFENHGAVLGRLEKQIQASLNTVDSLGARTRAMKRKLQGVDTIGSDKIEEVLGLLPPLENGEADSEIDAA
jgi:DNA recombination protein RmuC